MEKSLLNKAASEQTPLYLLTPNLLESWLADEDDCVTDLVRGNNFKAAAGEMLMVRLCEGKAAMLGGLGNDPVPEMLGLLATKLPKGDYFLSFAPGKLDRTRLARAFALGDYTYDRYLQEQESHARLYVAGAERESAMAQAKSICLARDLINTPANDLGPIALQEAIEEVGRQFGATVKSIVGDELLDAGYPMVHAVGRAAVQSPRIVHLSWGDDRHPAVSLVGKGVIFDTGGLNLKSGKFMRMMKKDMGGGANALATAQMIMQAKLPVRLNLFIPIVENAIGSNAYRPGDVIPSRLGLSVEIDNTDAEGRLILADALARACEDEPDLLINFATLTGAARTALGPEMAPYYATSDEWAGRLEAAAKAENDPVWRMPLWSGYDSWLSSDIADVCHTSSQPMAGSVTAALFLKRFVGDTDFIHFDIYGWSIKDLPARPKGGAAQGPLAVLAMLKEKYGQ